MLDGTWVLTWGQFALWGLPASDLLRVVARTAPTAAPDGGDLTVWRASCAETVYALRLRPADALMWLTAPDSGGESAGIAFWRQVAGHARQLALGGRFTRLPDGGLIPEPDPRLLDRLASLMPPECRAVALSPALTPTPAALVEDCWEKLVTAQVGMETPPALPRYAAPPYRAIFDLRAGYLALGMATPTGNRMGWPTRMAERVIVLKALGLAARTCPAVAAALPFLTFTGLAEIALSMEEAADFLAITAPSLRRAGHIILKGTADA